MKTRITELLGIEYPVIQGGMAWVCLLYTSGSISDHDPVVLRCVGRPGIIEADIVSEIFIKDWAVELSLIHILMELV